ncbi:MAG: ribonuclease HII [Patescibacteria group bacterium]|nr:ribonuclease HII [Patescibacteria group bacterium]
MKSRQKFIIGIDEVGRGALAGPVVVAAAAVAANFKTQGTRHKLGMLRDSKKLTQKQREAWFAYLKGHPGIGFAVARIYPRGIERLNISSAANLAAKRACKRLISVLRPPSSVARIYLDGGLFLGSKQSQPPNAATLVKGDEKITAIKIASIIAKVHRDRLMCRLAKKYAAYGFDIHKGYGTKNHYAALKKFGISAVHRKTFCNFDVKAK